MTLKIKLYDLHFMIRENHVDFFYLLLLFNHTYYKSYFNKLILDFDLGEEDMSLFLHYESTFCIQILYSVNTSFKREFG